MRRSLLCTFTLALLPFAAHAQQNGNIKHPGRDPRHKTVNTIPLIPIRVRQHQISGVGVIVFANMNFFTFLVFGCKMAAF